MYRLTSAAKSDLDMIYKEGFLRFGERTADAYAARITRTLQLIGGQPRMARERREYRRPIHVHPVGSHVILYAIEGPLVVILRVRHGHEDWKADPAADHSDL